MKRIKKIILGFLKNYFIFFLLVAFIITCCMLLFLSVFSATLNIELTGDNLGRAAKLTFGNVILLSLIFTLIDTVRRKITVERPMKKITQAAEQMINGDFSSRIPMHSLVGADENFVRIAECFNKMAEEFSSIETLRTDFIADVSHELKTPLAVIRNYGTLLKSEKLTDEQRFEYANAITDATRRLSDMMTNILKLNRLENQQIYPQKRELDLGEQLCECLLEYESVWEKKEINIETEIAENITVKEDGELLLLIWNNLFSNAFKFCREGGTVSIKLDTIDEWARVSVSDTGIGMSAEVGAHIFEKFYQGDFSRATEGNGLGLPLVKRVLDIVGGETTVESKVDEGTTFTVKIRRK